MLKRFITAGCLCAATVAYAESDGLSGQQLRELVAGAVVEIDTPVGTKIPIRYATDGQLFGQARDLAWYLGSSEDTGQWWIKADQLCHKWRRWFDGEPQCMRLKSSGRTIHWLNQDGNSGTAAIATPAPARVAPVTSPAQFAAAPAVPRPVQAAPVPTAVTVNNISRTEPETAPNAIMLLSADPSRAAPDTAAKTSASASDSMEETAPGAAAQQGVSPPAQPASRLYIVANVDRDDVLNVRSGPSADFDVVAELQPGSRGISITGACRSQWCPVQHETTSGWVNRMYLADEQGRTRTSSIEGILNDDAGRPGDFRDPPEAPRTCLTAAARALLERVEEKFGPVKLISTCRPGATIAGSGRPSRHASGNAVDFDAGHRKREIVEWLIQNHHEGGTMTYADMDHIHIDIGPHFVSIAGGEHWASWRNGGDQQARR